MNRIIGKTGVLAVGTGSFVYLYHSRKSYGRVLALQKDDSQVLTTEYCLPTDRVDGRAKVPSTCAKDDSPLVLQLVQVQVMFRHGARTPIHTIPKVPEVEYDPELVTRDHQASMFPYKLVSVVDGSTPDWSGYEKGLTRRLLKGGAGAGQLTGLGKEQMYNLGLRLRDCYRRRLDIATFDCKEVSILSTNIRRTVDSARCVLAGLYGKEQLNDYSLNCKPVEICIVDPNYNILIPNTITCGVLKKNNHSAMVHPDFLPGFKEQRLEVEEHIKKPWEKLMEPVTEAQTKIEAMRQFYEKEGVRARRRERNQHLQHYQYDPLMQPLYEERSRAVQRVERFWANVLNREPTLASIITEDDMKALIYLRDIRVEEFEGTIASGYRVHLYFDKNPYFINTHLCKEIFTEMKGGATPPPSKQTTIKWRPGLNLIPPEPEEPQVEEQEDSTEDEQKEKGKIKYARPPTCVVPTEIPETPKFIPRSFFHWVEYPTFEEQEVVGPAIKGDVWNNPQSLLDNEPKVHDPWDHKLNFVFGRDDTTARTTHGWPYPAQVRRYRDLMDTNATTILYYAMAGQTPHVRNVVTRLSVGPLVTEMLEQARKMVCGEKATKLCLYSSHDSTMTALMEAFCIWDNKWPPFGSDLRLELYKEVGKRDFYVRVLYNGKEQRIRDQTESYMHWVDFCSAMRKLVIRPDEMERICRSNILERIAQGVLKHDKGEVETLETKEETETPAGM